MDSPESPHPTDKADAEKVKRRLLFCSFCGKSQEQVDWLIAGPTVYICDECTDLCAEIVDNKNAQNKETEVQNLAQLTYRLMVSPIQEHERSELRDEIESIAAKIRGRRLYRNGDIVAGTQLLRIVGSGNFSHVWEAVPRPLPKLPGSKLGQSDANSDAYWDPDVSGSVPNRVAVKIFDQGKLTIGLMLWRFQRGIRAMEHLTTLGGETPRSVVRFNKALPSRLGFAMQYLPGGDLTKIRTLGWSRKRKLEVFHTVCEAVQFAHRQGIIHRDIKPANIVLDDDNEPVLTDFDIADIVFAATESVYAGNMGTPQFAAPEQLAGAVGSSPMADTYSLGKLLYFLICEEAPPFGSAEPSYWPRHLDRLGDPQLAACVHRAIQHDPAHRFASVNDLLMATHSERTMSLPPRSTSMGTAATLSYHSDTESTHQPGVRTTEAREVPEIEASPASVRALVNSSGPMVDVIILTAITLEYHAVLQVHAGAWETSSWQTSKAGNGLPLSFRTFRGKGGAPLRVAVAQSGDMGTIAAAGALMPLVQAYAPKCIAMSGVCAGRPGKTNLGDVIAAERLFFHDTGKQLPDDVQQDLRTYNLRDDWKVALEHFDFINIFRDAEWWCKRPVPYQWQENWVLMKLLDGVADPAGLPEYAEFCPQWEIVIDSLWRSGHVKDGQLTLTEEGRARIQRILIRHRNRFPDLSPSGTVFPFRVHVSPMGSGNKVIEDVNVWSFVSEHMRKTLGLEMEAAVLGALANMQHSRRLDALVMKGVMDFANDGRDDHFKQYAARAAAECLLAFLREYV